MQRNQLFASAICFASDEASQSGAPSPIVVSTVQPVPSIETVTAITDADKAARAKLAAKLLAKRQASTGETPSASKPARKPAKQSASKPGASKPATPAKPTQAARDAVNAAKADATRLARQAAALAVAAFYSGNSKPFKAAGDRFADLNFANAKSATPRQAGLFLALITYGRGNLRSDGTFTRGGFNVPAKLINPNAKPGDTVRAQPESGCLGNAIGRAVDYVSGPKSGRDQTAQILRLRVPTVLAEIQAAFGDKQAAAARKLLASYTAKQAA